MRWRSSALHTGHFASGRGTRPDPALGYGVKRRRWLRQHGQYRWNPKNLARLSQRRIPSAAPRRSVLTCLTSLADLTVRVLHLHAIVLSDELNQCSRPVLLPPLNRRLSQGDAYARAMNAPCRKKFVSGFAATTPRCRSA